MAALSFPSLPANGDVFDNFIYDSAKGVWRRTMWAKVSGGNTTTTYTDPSGQSWTAHIFTSSGTLTVDKAGPLDTLCVGGGGGMGNRYSREGRGGAGAVRYGWQEFKETGDYTIVIGGDTSITAPSGSIILASGRGMSGFANENNGSYGSNGEGGGGSQGGISKNSGARNGGGSAGPLYGGSNGEWEGIELYYEGSALFYGRGGQGSISNTTAGWGAGSGGSVWAQGGRAGIVVVRYKN